MINQREVRHFKIENMGCTSCVETIKSYLINNLNLREVQFNLAEKSINLEGDIDNDEVINSLEQLGYEAKLLTEENYNDKSDYETTVVSRTAISIFVALPLIFNMIFPIFPSIGELHGYATYLVISVVTFLVIAYSGKEIYRSAYHAFVHHQANMDTLVALGTGAAWLYSTLVVLFSHHLHLNSSNLYFESAVVILAFVNLGALLEDRAKSKSNQAIKHLIALAPLQATVIMQDEEMIVPIAQVKPGQLCKVYPGEKVPVDGIITAGSTRINESMLTGEPLAVKKQIGSQVFAGTVNTTGSFFFSVQQTQKNTALAQIIELVKQAQNTKPNISRLADSISHYFVPTVIIIAIMTTLLWFNLGYSINLILTAAMSVLIIACPCALGLATPIATLCGIGKSAESGILIKKGQSLQVMSQVTDIIFDKTGTITAAKPSIIYASAIDGYDIASLTAYAASLESHSEHPLAQAVLDHAHLLKLDIAQATDVNVLEGLGIGGQIAGKPCLVGNQALLQKNNITTGLHAEKIAQFEKEGNTIILVAYDKLFLGFFAINDSIKPKAKETIEWMQQLKIKTHLISGDNQQAVSLLAQKLGFDHAQGDCLPKNKETLVNTLKSEGKIVGMIGDGINDAPALSQADVGLAIGNGTDIAIESADVVLLNESLETITHAFIIAKATMTTIKQNLAGAFIYNFVGIPIAAGILYPSLGLLLSPMLAGAAMAASSLTVVLNANRLRLIKLPGN